MTRSGHDLANEPTPGRQRNFAACCGQNCLQEPYKIEPTHVAAYVEGVQRRLAAPSIKLQLAAVRMLFDWLVVAKVLATNPASSVRGPKRSVRIGETPALGLGAIAEADKRRRVN